MTPKRPTRGARKPRRSTRPHKLADTRRSGDHGAKPAVPRPTKPRTGLQKRRAEQIAEMEDVVRQIAGVRTSDVAQHLVGQLSKLQPWDNQRSDAERWSAAVTMLAELRPASGPEALLAVQLIGVHHAATQFLARATCEGQTFGDTDANVLRATRLMRLFNEQLGVMETLKGTTRRPNVTVEHVHVHSGGQAIVGTVSGAKKERGRAPDE